MSRSAAAEWIDELHDVLVGLSRLRDMGQRAESAIEAVLALPDLRRLRLTWGLAVPLADDDGRDGRQEMVRLLGAERVWLIEAAVSGRARSLEPFAGLWARYQRFAERIHGVVFVADVDASVVRAFQRQDVGRRSAERVDRPCPAGVGAAPVPGASRAAPG